jgi:hypothetical protein
MSEKWTIEKINQLINDKVQEDLNLEYKGAKALENTDHNKKEITKDVSAMANSDGGTIIYGIKENPPFPEAIEPINQTTVTKEWLAQVISSSIHPPINVIITPVSIDNGNDVVYVVDIPKGETAHQAKDKRYHKRFNTTTDAMEDYEIRDVMGRNKFPKLEPSFKIVKKYTYYHNGIGTRIVNKSELQHGHIGIISCFLDVTVKNIGTVYAKYVNALFYIPVDSIIGKRDFYASDDELTEEDGIKCYEYYEDNTIRDIVGNHTPHSTPNYGPARYAPILPGLSTTWEIHLGNFVRDCEISDKYRLKWIIHADNATPISGEACLADIKIEERDV